MLPRISGMLVEHYGRLRLMFLNYSRTRQIALIAALIFAFTIPAAAQNSDYATTYPTVAALNAAVMPPRDRVELAERLHGISSADIPPTPTSVSYTHLTLPTK